MIGAKLPVSFLNRPVGDVKMPHLRCPSYIVRGGTVDSMLSLSGRVFSRGWHSDGTDIWEELAAWLTALYAFDK